MSTMTMDYVLPYLRKYLADPVVLSSLPGDSPLVAQVPEWWREVLRGDRDHRIRRTLQEWERYRAQLSSVLGFLETHLTDIFLLTDQNLVTGQTSIRLLYEVERPDGRSMYYVGGNPLQKSPTPSVQAIWSSLSADFRQFYEAFHNGWYYLASNSMGPAPAEDFVIMDELEWGILEDIGDPGCDLKNLVAVYTNGMGGYVALSIDRRQAHGDVLWWKDKPPRLNIDAWAVMDAWTEIGLSQ